MKARVDGYRDLEVKKRRRLRSSGRGNELYFAAINRAKRQTEMQTVTVLTADTLELGEPRTVFAAPIHGTADGYRYAWGNTLSPMFDVAPDDERYCLPLS